MSNEESSDSLRSALESAYETIESGQTGGASDGDYIPELDSPEVEAPQAEIKGEVSEGQSPKNSESTRDASGRFQKKAKEEAAATAKDPSSEQKGEVKTEPQQVSDVDPPLSWRADEKDAFRSLPRPVQETIARREQERERAWNRSNMEIAAFKRRYQGIDQVLQPFEDQWARQGLEATTVIKNMIAWQKRLDENPQQALAELAASYGVEAATIGEATPRTDPKISHLETEIRQLREALVTRQSAEAEGYLSQVSNGISQFAEERGADGKPVRPYFNDVYSEMLPIAAALKASNPNAAPTQILSEAYDRAIYANPQIRQRLIDEKIAAEQAKRIAETRTKASQAKAAGSLLTNGSGVSMSSGSPETLRATLSQAWDELASN